VLGKQKKLKSFRDRLAKGRIVDFWMDPQELCTKKVTAVVNATKSFPGPGWVRGNQAADPQLLMDMRRLLQENEALNKRLAGPSINFAAVEKWRSRWAECSMKYGGSYFLYSRMVSETSRIAISLLRIGKRTDRGLEFDIHNVDNRDVTGATPVVYRYRGLMLPVSDCLYFVGEERNLDEMFCMITSSSQVSPPSNLQGYLLAVGVRPGMRMATGTNVVAVFKGKALLEPRHTSKQLGIVLDGKVPRRIRELLAQPA
jgi:hypothetical protein